MSRGDFVCLRSRHFEVWRVRRAKNPSPDAALGDGIARSATDATIKFQRRKSRCGFSGGGRLSGGTGDFFNGGGVAGAAAGTTAG